MKKVAVILALFAMLVLSVGSVEAHGKTVSSFRSFGGHYHRGVSSFGYAKPLFLNSFSTYGYGSYYAPPVVSVAPFYTAPTYVAPAFNTFAAPYCPPVVNTFGGYGGVLPSFHCR
jgi:hypothetical protein